MNCSVEIVKMCDNMENEVKEYIIKNHPDVNNWEGDIKPPIKLGWFKPTIYFNYFTSNIFIDEIRFLYIAINNRMLPACKGDFKYSTCPKSEEIEYLVKNWDIIKKIIFDYIDNGKGMINKPTEDDICELRNCQLLEKLKA